MRRFYTLNNSGRTTKLFPDVVGTFLRLREKTKDLKAILGGFGIVKNMLNVQYDLILLQIDESIEKTKKARERRAKFHSYIFHILQHFTTKLRNFTNFRMLFNAVVPNLPYFFLICPLCNRSINADGVQSWTRSLTGATIKVGKSYTVE